MRIRFVFAVVALCLLWGPAASANKFPDLPGMRTADRVTGGSPAAAKDKSVKPAASSAPSVQQAVTAAAKKEKPAVDARPILSLPGAGAIPVLRSTVEVGVGSASGHAPGNGLVTVAGLLSLGAIAGLIALRRLGVL